MVLLIKCINSFYVLIIRKSIIYIFTFALNTSKYLRIFPYPLIGITQIHIYYCHTNSLQQALDRLTLFLTRKLLLPTFLSMRLSSKRRKFSTSINNNNKSNLFCILNQKGPHHLHFDDSNHIMLSVSSQHLLTIFIRYNNHSLFHLGSIKYSSGFLWTLFKIHIISMMPKSLSSAKGKLKTIGIFNILPNLQQTHGIRNKVA